MSIAPAASTSEARLRWAVMAPFLVAVLLLVLLSLVGSHALSAARAYAASESLWSRAQKDAVLQLTRYAQSRRGEDFEGYRAAMAVPLGDARARRALEAPQPDLDAARSGLVEGLNHPDDVDGMIWLFRTFRDTAMMSSAVATWTEADAVIERLDALARAAQADVEAGVDDAPHLRSLREQLPAIDAELTTLARRFADTMGDAARAAQVAVLMAIVLLAVVTGVGAVLLSSRLLRHRLQVEAALRISEERLTRALEASGLCLWDFDVASGRVYLSESWSRQLGGPGVETRTTYADLAKMVPKDEHGALHTALIAALKDGHHPYRVEHRVRRPDGSVFWNLSEGRVVERDAAGRAVRLVGTNRDITALKTAESARHELEVQLRESQKMEAIGTLAAGIAHDFNNILGAILGSVALVREEIKPGDPALRGLEQIHRSARRARTLVRQILAFGRRQPQELVSRPLRPLVQDGLAMMRATLPAKVTLEARLDPRPMHVMADGIQIQQVLMNLCTNAWHALQGGAGRIEVGIRPMTWGADGKAAPGGLPAGDYVHLWVSDNGRGMDALTRARVFEPFFTTKPVGKGTGLGLSVVHGIVATHHGAITVDSTPGQGSTFNIYLPMAEARPRHEASGWGTLEPLPRRGVGQHVLYVDDDEVMATVVEQLLRRVGYRVTCHHDPRKALDDVRRQAQAFDVVVSDFNMPEISGLDLARQVAEVRADLPVVIISGHVTEDQRAEMLGCGVRSLIRKENAVEELGGVVHEVLGSP